MCVYAVERCGDFCRRGWESGRGGAVEAGLCGPVNSSNSNSTASCAHNDAIWQWGDAPHQLLAVVPTDTFSQTDRRA